MELNGQLLLNRREKVVRDILIVLNPFTLVWLRGLGCTCVPFVLGWLHWPLPTKNL